MAETRNPKPKIIQAGEKGRVTKVILSSGTIPWVTKPLLQKGHQSFHESRVLMP
jgi:hypothetical protein